jgi:hypothetical protein
MSAVAQAAMQEHGRWLRALCDLAQAWVRDTDGLTCWVKEGGERKRSDVPNLINAYVDLIFAFGLAKLGESDAARELLARAQSALNSADDAHTFLLGAFRHRIQQGLDAKPHTGPLPAEQMEALERMWLLPRYVVDRLRKHSRILEPDQRINPYRRWGPHPNDFGVALAELTDLTDSGEIVRRIDRLLAAPDGSRGIEPRARVLRAALEAAPRVGEDFAKRMLDQALPTYDALPEPKDRGTLIEQAAFLEKALFVAGHFGRIEHVHPLVARFQRMLQTQNVLQPMLLLEPRTVLDTLGETSFRALRKLGMREEIDQLSGQMADVVRAAKGLYKTGELCVLLRLASSWYYLGRDAQAEAILQATWAVLLKGELAPRDQTQLAASYAAAVGQAPVEVAQKRLEELFEKLKGVRDAYTTSPYFSVSHLDVVEAAVLAACTRARPT